MAVPLEVERAHAELNRAADLFLRGVVGRKLADRVDLTATMAFVLLGVEVVGLRGAFGEAIVTSQLAIDVCRAAIGATMLILDEAQQGEAFECGASLAAANDHLDGRHRARCR